MKNVKPSKFTLFIRKVRKPFLHCWFCAYLHGQYGHISAVVREKRGVTSIPYQDSLKLLFNFGMPTFQVSFQSENLLLRCQRLGTMSLFTVCIRILDGFFLERCLGQRSILEIEQLCLHYVRILRHLQY